MMLVVNGQARSKTYVATYPNGWYKIAESSELPIGKVLEVQAVGKVWASSCTCACVYVSNLFTDGVAF